MPTKTCPAPGAQGSAALPVPPPGAVINIAGGEGGGSPASSRCAPDERRGGSASLADLHGNVCRAHAELMPALAAPTRAHRSGPGLPSHPGTSSVLLWACSPPVLFYFLAVMSSCWTTEGFCSLKSPGGASSCLQTEAPGDLWCICSRPLPLRLLPPCSCRQPLQNVSSVPCWSHRGWKGPSGPPSPAISLTYSVPSPSHVP